ncbi:MAG: exopolysaccharide biosynthesis protein [Methylophilaceae bacterium]|nr:exopolysaccharide biosynthesis protein [Methylophilaceae bacterium]
MCDYHTLINTLHGFAERAKGGHLTLGEAMDTLDEAAYAFIAIILVLPFLQPLPLGPLTVIGGLTFATLGWQLMRGHESPVLPEKVRRVEFSEHTWHIIVNVCLKIVGFCRKFTRPRYTFLVSGRQGQKVGGFVLLAGGALMAIPFGVLPLNNVLPGLAILFYGIGELEEDGLMIFVAFFWLVVTVVYFSVFFIMLWLFGKEALTYFGG